MTHSSFISEVVIKPIDADNIIAYAERKPNKPLSEAQKNKIRSTVANDHVLIDLASLHNQFLTLKDTVGLLIGLDDEQVANIHELFATVHDYKKLDKRERADTDVLKNMVATERKLLPLNNVIAWWTSNSESLKKLYFWEETANSVTQIARENNEAEEAITKRLHDLTDIKNEWESHQIFAGYLSSALIQFYNDYICKMENWLSDILDPEQSNTNEWPPEITSYVRNAYNELQELKKIVINSMLYRLKTAEYYKDICADDLLYYTCHQIRERCNLDLFSNGTKPLPRHSMTINIINNFAASIAGYCKDKPQAKSLENKFNALAIRNVPARWQAFCTAKTDFNNLKNCPVILYAGNVLPRLIEEAFLHSNIVQEILTSNCLDDQNFVLNKILKLCDITQQEQQRLGKMKNDKLNAVIVKIIAEQKNACVSLFNPLLTRVGLEIQNQNNLLLDTVFQGNEIDPEVVSRLTNQTENANLFLDHFNNQTWSPETDIILGLCNKIRMHIGKNQTITPINVTNIMKLIKYLFPNKHISDFAELCDVLTTITSTSQKLHHENEAGFMHLMMNTVESPTLSKETMSDALDRHKYIAKSYAETWDDRYDDSSDLDPDHVYMHQLCSYMRNVLINTIEISPYIDFDNFDTSEIPKALNNLEADYFNKNSLAKQKEQINSLKNTLQHKIAQKLNDTFLIKDHLYNQTSRMIDIEKLSSLLARVEQFFSDSECKTLLLGAIRKATKSLVKNYILANIESDEPIDSNYIQQLNKLVVEDTIRLQANDDDIRKLFATYISTYNGANNNMALLSVQLYASAHSQADAAALLAYSHKRLNFIKSSRTCNPDDYQFFTAFCQSRAIASVFDETKKSFAALIQTALSDSNTVWSHATACLIELFGDKDSVHNYRLKRIKEMNASITAKNDAAISSDQLINAFATTINSKLSDRETHQHIQKLRTLRFIIGLEANLPPGQENAAHQPNPDKDFYSDYYGVANIVSIISNIDKAIEVATKSNKPQSAQIINEDEYKKMLRLTSCLKPMRKLYSIYGKNKSSHDFLNEIDEFEKKIGLHYKLNTVLKSQTSLLDISNDNLELHNIILTIIDTLVDIESSPLLSEKNIDQYLAFFDTQILVKLENLLRNKINLTYKTLFTISNAINYITSDKLKLLLISANKNYIDENPNWLSLINHLGERSNATYLENLTTQSATSQLDESEFQRILNFSKRLAEIKHTSQALIKKDLLFAAGITSLDTSVPFWESLKSHSVSNKQLLNLWSACTHKLLDENLNPYTNNDYIVFLVKFITNISDIIYARASNDAALVDKFTDLLADVFAIKNYITNLVPENERRSTQLGRYSIWQNISEIEKSIQPLLALVDKLFVVKLMQKIEKFTLQKISKDKLADFKKYANDPIITTAEITKQLGIKHADDGEKVANMMHIYSYLTLVYNKLRPATHIIEQIQRIIADSKSDQKLATASAYMDSLNELANLSQKYFTPSNDKSILLASQKKSSIFHFTT